MLIETSHVSTIKRKSDLYESMKMKDWTQVKELLYSIDIQRLVKLNSYTLFMASYCGPANIVRMIFDVSPGQVHFKDSFGNTPLHNALSNYGAEAKEVVEFLLNVAPELARTTNNSGMLPLHQAMLNRRSPEIVRLLLQAFPEGIHQGSHFVGSPAQLFFDEWLDELEDYVDNFQKLRSFEGPDGNDLEIVSQTFLMIVETAVGIQSSRKTNDLEVLPVHSALEIADMLIPPVFLKLMITAFKDESRRIDENGNYPLHIGLNQRHMNTEIVESLIEANPEALTCPNKEGKIPLALATESDQEREIIQRLIYSSLQAMYSRIKLWG